MTANQIQRYSITPPTERDTGGEFVLHSDHLASRAADAEKIRTLEAALREALAVCELSVKGHPANGNTNCPDCITSRAAEAAIPKIRAVLSATKEPVQ